MEKTLINRVAQSGIITLNLEDYFPQTEVVDFDLKNNLFMELILKEKEFRADLKAIDWSIYENKVICLFCSTDAIIPVWAYMLVSSLASPISKEIFVGTKNEYIKHHYYSVLSEIDVSKFENARIVIKGCSEKPVPPSAYAFLTELLRPVAKSIMYGEPCSTVPIYKKPLRTVSVKK